jgi:sialate O-acetylesterase
MKLFTLILLFLNTIASMQRSNTDIEIPSIFSDNMVLQQNSKVSFWGKAEPGLNVNIKASWEESANTTVNTEGSWLVSVNTPSAGGPFEINLQIGDSVITYKNVLTGEVWLCSGQSNMEMPLQGWPPNDTIANSKEEIENANYPNIRLFTVSRAFSNKREFNCTGEWEECTPQTASSFSATAYFFGRKLSEELNIPVGLIHSSWGGTPVESWTSAEFLKEVNEYKSIVNDIKSSETDVKKYNDWLLSHQIVDVNDKAEADKWMNLEFDDAECSETDYPDSNWRVMNLPTLWEATDVGNIDGVIWFRKKVQIPENWKGEDLVLELGPVDDMDRTYVNGALIGAYEKQGFWQTDRIYNVPANLIQSNELQIAVRVIDTQGGGGLFGAKEKMKIHPTGSNNSISLSDEWKYLPVAQYSDQKFFVFGTKQNDYEKRPLLKINLSAYTPTMLFNGMINPLIPYSISGVIWYQGEANTGNPEAYTTLFPLMINNWREEWDREFPFYYVQIAPFDYGNETHSEKLRESQLKALSVPNTGMVVTLDIGDTNTIHPANKKDVGERLARWALAKNYNKDIYYSGPIYKSMEIAGDKIILSFDYADNGLIIKGINSKNNFLIAGEDKIFKEAKIEIKHNKLILSNPEIRNPVAVRYAWNNLDAATLFNKEGLPASSFRTDIWKK